MKSCRFILKDLDCAACGKKIEDRISREEGYENVNVNFSTLNLSFKTNKDNPKQEIIKIIKEVEPEVKVLDINEKSKDNDQRDFLDIFRLVLGIGIYLIGLKLRLQVTIQIISTVICILILLSKTMRKAVSEVKRKVLDENILITISVIGACLVGKTFEGIMVITLYEIGKILESKAINKTRNSISNLMDIKPEKRRNKSSKSR